MGYDFIGVKMLDSLKIEYHLKTIKLCEEIIKREKESVPYTIYNESIVKDMERKIRHSKKVLGVMYNV